MNVFISRKGLKSFLLLANLCGLVFCAEETSKVDVEDDDLKDVIGRLYEENHEWDYDPNDMLSYPKEKRKGVANEIGNKFKAVFGNFHSTPPDLELHGTDDDVKMTVTDTLVKSDVLQHDLNECKREISGMKINIQNEKSRSSGLEKQLLKEGSVDTTAFYARTVHHFVSLLKLQDVKPYLSSDSDSYIQRLDVRVSLANINSLQQFAKYQNNIREVDSFFMNSFTLLENDNTEKTWWDTIVVIGDKIQLWWLGSTRIGVESWLNVFCILFVLLGSWALFLFVQDVQRNLRWTRIVWMMMLILFAICCLWEGVHLQKVQQSRRLAKIAKLGHSELPPECRPGAQQQHGVWYWLQHSVFGKADICEKFFEEMTVHVSDEISPGVIISETMSRFLLQPLEHLGSKSSKFMSDFFSGVPTIYLVPSVLFFVVLFTLILFFISGYAVDFPLWMGGIRPAYNNNNAPPGDPDAQFTTKAMEQMRIEREQFLQESRVMLTEITRASLQHSQTMPIVRASAGILESHLERLISQQLNRVMLPTVASEFQEKRRVSIAKLPALTITSTPIVNSCGTAGHSSNMSTAVNGLFDVTDCPRENGRQLVIPVIAPVPVKTPGMLRVTDDSSTDSEFFRQVRDILNKSSSNDSDNLDTSSTRRRRLPVKSKVSEEDLSVQSKEFLHQMRQTMSESDL